MKLRHAVGGILILLLGGCGYAGWKYINGIANPVVALDAAAFPGIPSEASHIYARENPIGGSYKFKIAEEPFLAWVKERNFQDLGMRSSDGSYTKTDGKHIQIYINKAIIENVTIQDGLYFQNRAPNGGGYTVAYDRKTGWAYYNWSTH